MVTLLWQSREFGRMLGYDMTIRFLLRQITGSSVEKDPEGTKVDSGRPVKGNESFRTGLGAGRGVFLFRKKFKNVKEHFSKRKKMDLQGIDLGDGEVRTGLQDS